ncbi:molybdate ABC transporter substrate-binding protein [Dichotomicrobium thermohalophilum]|uniref:Molybdate transport system substrate-binding protein n=1 Tax=Dichotomicrobium thermohalophilum TaxID=933063 RepID=A0A397Q912_9HYPH|nr:molybdate ABC transporter substrate-binding protein [Dichotomicrobium thermohalophilum]RIA56315.1 molybdate transport system substrate-binding protein [Dichotomicrobium thermohalophilum]
MSERFFGAPCRFWLVGLAAIIITAAPASARAGEAIVAVAANFQEVAEELETMFEETSGNSLTVTTGSTGKLYAQIKNGAPFDVFLAADQARPERLAAEGEAVPGSRFTYAVGQIVLWSPRPEGVAADGLQTLKNGTFDNLAIANPDLAPYGLAAKQTLQHYDLWDALADRIVMGQNIGQTFSMVATQNAQLGFVAKSYVVSPRNEQPGSHWDVPAKAHDPIRQDAVLLKHGTDNAAARAFADFLRSEAARDVIKRFGYAVE